MNERERVQLNIQLPVEALEGFSRLTEQLRLLAEALGGGGPAPASPRAKALERGENTAFDFGQFQRMGRGPGEPEGVRADTKDIAGADGVEGAVRRAVEDPDAAWQAEEPGGADVPSAPAETAVQAIPLEEPEGQTAPAPQQEAPEEPPRRTEEEAGLELEAQPLRVEVEEQAVEAVSVQAEPDTPVPDAPAVRMELESQIPEAEEVWTETEDPSTEAAEAREEVIRTLETPPGVGAEMTAMPETLKSRWTDVTEELVAAGPAPLTAESVSLAFRRDGRRYDSGFPLY